MARRKIVIENHKGQIMQIRQCSEPTQEVRQIYTALKYHQILLPRKKSVWHTGEILKNDKSDCQIVMDG
jgi:predicted NAD/FAD-binding protein